MLEMLEMPELVQEVEVLEQVVRNIQFQLHLEPHIQLLLALVVL
jgi:hypothetical protein